MPACSCRKSSTRSIPSSSIAVRAHLDADESFGKRGRRRALLSPALGCLPSSYTSRDRGHALQQRPAIESGLLVLHIYASERVFRRKLQNPGIPGAQDAAEVRGVQTA
jgi:hypothetical protein